LEDTLLFHLRAHRLPTPEREYAFARDVGRRWRFDFAWPALKVAVECDGSVYAQGRHTRGKGYEQDAEKLNTAVLMGWDVVRFSGGMIRSGEAVETIRKLLALKGQADAT
jgi:very-short-patch-repair endonuclease